MTILGIWRILTLTIVNETRPMERFANVGNYASYWRCVRREGISNDKIHLVIVTRQIKSKPFSIAVRSYPDLYRL